jgi:hypothetical protein
MSTEPIRVHDLPEEAKRLRRETENLLKELNARGPTRALLLRARDLRKRVKAQGSTIERLIAIETATVIALRERLGREPVEGEEITERDEARAEEIVTSLQSPVGNC